MLYIEAAIGCPRFCWILPLFCISFSHRKSEALQPIHIMHSRVVNRIEDNPDAATTSHIKAATHFADRPHRSHAHHSIYVPDSGDLGDRHPHLYPSGFDHRTNSGDSGNNGLIAKAEAITFLEGCDRHSVLVS